MESMTDIAILGYGFLGKSLVDDLADGQQRMHVLSRTPPTRGDIAGVRFQVGDAGERATLEAVINSGLTVFAVGSTFPSLPPDQLHTYASREKEILKLALTVTAERGGRFVYLSSSAIYGEVLAGCANETDLPSPISAYGHHKLACEQFCLEQAQMIGLPLTILRISNPFGSRQITERRQGLIGIVLDNLRLNRSTQVRGDGSAIRDYVPVNVVSAVIKRLAENPGRQVPEILNVCSGEGLSTSDVLDRLSIWLGRQIPVEHIPPAAGEIRRSVLDPSRLKCWAPHLPDASFSAGLAALGSTLNISIR